MTINNGTEKGEGMGPSAEAAPGRGARRGAPKVLDLFSGIGGFALAFEAAGFQTVAFAEIEPYPCKVLAQHWPEVPNLGDVRGIDGSAYAGIDAVCGGFPCQDISLAGKGAGITGARSGLWSEMLRIIRGARPAFCLLENVPALRTRGADHVLEGLEEAGYAARAFVVGAVAAGANHRRERVWIVAYARGRGWDGRANYKQGQTLPDQLECGGAGPESKILANTEGQPIGSGLCANEPARFGRGRPGDGGMPGDASDTCGPGLEKRQGPEGQRPLAATAGSDWWAVEPALGRVADGVPNRAHRIKALGNSIVPAVAHRFAQWIYGELTAQRAPEAASAGGTP